VKNLAEEKNQIGNPGILGDDRTTIVAETFSSPTALAHNRQLRFELEEPTTTA